MQLIFQGIFGFAKFCWIIDQIVVRGDELEYHSIRRCLETWTIFLSKMK